MTSLAVTVFILVYLGMALGRVPGLRLERTGVALLGLGFWRDVTALRHAGMALVILVILKVFVIDMAGLKGLLRVSSFLGLGATLIGLGYAYRHFGMDPGRSTTASPRQRR